MILEVVVLDVKPGEETEFEDTFRAAQSIISGIDGYISHQLQNAWKRKTDISF